MKKTIVLFLLVGALAALTFVGCGSTSANGQSETTFDQLLADANMEEAEITYSYRIVVPDSLKREKREWITETVRAASNQMTGGDYEDPEDVVEEVSEQAEKEFGEMKKITFLHFSFKGASAGNSEWVEVEDLTPAQKKVFDFLNK